MGKDSTPDANSYEGLTANKCSGLGTVAEDKCTALTTSVDGKVGNWQLAFGVTLGVGVLVAAVLGLMLFFRKSS